MIVRLCLWLHILSLIIFVECRASIASDFDISHLMVWGMEAYIIALGYMSSASLKTSCPHGLSLLGKEYGPLDSKYTVLNSMLKAHL
jgi:hypothetical protein